MSRLITFLLLLNTKLALSKYDFGYSECFYNKYKTKCFGQGYTLSRTGRALTDFPPLEYKEECLMIPDNQIQKFPDNLVDYATLYTLDVARNLITEIPDDLDVLNKLKVLDLSENRISTLSSTTRYPRTLEAFILKGNSLKALPNALVIPNLFVLDLSHNAFRDIPREFCVSKQLIRVDFTGNALLGDVSKYVGILNDCRNANGISFCLFTDRDYIKCDCNTLRPILLTQPSFQMGTASLNQNMQCGTTSGVANFTGRKLFDVDLADVGAVCPKDHQSVSGINNKGSAVSRLNNELGFGILTLAAVLALRV